MINPTFLTLGHHIYPRLHWGKVFAEPSRSSHGSRGSKLRLWSKKSESISEWVPPNSIQDHQGEGNERIGYHLSWNTTLAPLLEKTRINLHIAQYKRAQTRKIFTQLFFVIYHLCVCDSACFNASVFFDQHLEDSNAPRGLVFLRMKENICKLHVKWLIDIWPHDKRRLLPTPPQLTQLSSGNSPNVSLLEEAGA